MSARRLSGWRARAGAAGQAWAWPWATQAARDGRWALLLVTACVSWLVGGWYWQDELDALERLQQEVQALQSRLDSTVQAASVSVSMSPPEGLQEASAADPGAAPPLATQQAQVWAWLQQGLHSHGLQVQSLRPGALEDGEGLPSQTVVLQLQGRWRDWLAFERRLGALAHWWTPEQWQVAFASDTDEAVKLVWHWRLGWRAPADASRLATALPDWPLPAGAVGDARGAQASDPAQGWRLQGTWQQDGVWHAVLVRGAQRQVVVPGQHLWAQGQRTRGLRVQRVSATGIGLLPIDVPGPPLNLELSGEGRR